MAELTWSALRGALVDRYGELRARLTRLLGSEDLASESLHDVWLRLHRTDAIAPIRNPGAYLIRIALNAAIDRRRAEARFSALDEVEAMLEIADPAPDPARRAEARIEAERLERALQNVPERARAILMAVRLDGLSHQQVATRFGISRRTVVYELKRAMAAIERHLETATGDDCASEPRESSMSNGRLRDGDIDPG